MCTDFPDQLAADVPRKLEHPFENVPVLDWWKYDYDHVYVVLNPFFRVPGYTPQTAAFGPMRVTGDAADVLELVNEGVVERENEAPENFHDIIKQTGTAVRWSEVAQAVGAVDFDRFARIVWLQTIAGQAGEDNALMSEQLQEFCDQTGLYMPEEDLLPAVLETTVGRYLEALGVDEVTLWNEWREISRDCPVSAFEPDNPATGLPGDKLTAVSTDGLLLSWGYDDVAGLLALTDEMRHRVDPAQFFEGFWASAETTSLVFAPEGAPPPSRRN